jgi:hypothetical protein
VYWNNIYDVCGTYQKGSLGYRLTSGKRVLSHNLPVPTKLNWQNRKESFRIKTTENINSATAVWLWMALANGLRYSVTLGTLVGTMSEFSSILTLQITMVGFAGKWFN